MAVKIISDSTCDLSEELIKKYDIDIAPLTVILGEKNGHDGTEITPDDIYKYVDASGELPKTSAVSIWEYTNTFKSWREQGYEIVHFCISNKFSSSVQNAYSAAQEVNGVYVVDTMNLSTGQGLVVLRAAELAKEGKSAEEIVKECEDMIPRVEASFVINSIDYLRKGGRCSALAALGANVFQIKPCINVIDGAMTTGKKYRGTIKKVMQDYSKDRLSGRDDIDKHRIFITHTKCDESEVEAVKQLVMQYCPDVDEILETVAGATVTTHCGPETLGVLFVRKK